MVFTDEVPYHSLLIEKLHDGAVCFLFDLFMQLRQLDLDALVDFMLFFVVHGTGLELRLLESTGH